MVEPCLVGSKAVFGLDFVLWESVEQPHAFVSEGEATEGERKNAY